MVSRHYLKNRILRENLINLIGEGYLVDEFIVDKGHRKGPERHCITSTGIVNIFNQCSGKLVTRLIARPGQIKRYYGEYPPQWLIDIATVHVKQGLNNF